MICLLLIELDVGGAMQFWDMVGSTFGEGEERNGLKLMLKEESRNEFRI